MKEDSYPHSPEEVGDTMADLYRHQGDKVMLSLLESAEAAIDFDAGIQGQRVEGPGSC